MHNVRAETLTGGLNNSITAILPYTPTSFTGRRPSGVTTYISIRVFLAIIKFKSSGDVKLPEIEEQKIIHTVLENDFLCTSSLAKFYKKLTR